MSHSQKNAARRQIQRGGKLKKRFTIRIGAAHEERHRNHESIPMSSFHGMPFSLPLKRKAADRSSAASLLARPEAFRPQRLFDLRCNVQAFFPLDLEDTASPPRVFCSTFPGKNFAHSQWYAQRGDARSCECPVKSGQANYFLPCAPVRPS